MKRSLLDPLPRQLSTQALAVLVALVLCGTGIAVARYLDSDPHDLRSPGEVHAAPAEESGNEPYRRSPASFRPSSGLTSAPVRGSLSGKSSSGGSSWGGSSWGSSGCSTSSSPAALDSRGAAACAPSPTKSNAPTTFRATAADS